jgi:hypothetical protein
MGASDRLGVALPAQQVFLAGDLPRAAETVGRAECVAQCLKGATRGRSTAKGA